MRCVAGMERRRRLKRLVFVRRLVELLFEVRSSLVVSIRLLTLLLLRTVDPMYFVSHTLDVRTIADFDFSDPPKSSCCTVLPRKLNEYSAGDELCVIFTTPIEQC